MYGADTQTHITIVACPKKSFAIEGGVWNGCPPAYVRLASKLKFSISLGGKPDDSGSREIRICVYFCLTTRLTNHNIVKEE